MPHQTASPHGEITRPGIATSAEVDITTLTDRMCEEVGASNGVILSPALIGAWSRKPSMREVRPQ
jgi:hypothetical protein